MIGREPGSGVEPGETEERDTRWPRVQRHRGGSETDVYGIEREVKKHSERQF